MEALDRKPPTVRAIYGEFVGSGINKRYLRHYFACLQELRIPCSAPSTFHGSCGANVSSLTTSLQAFREAVAWPSLQQELRQRNHSRGYL